MESLEANITHIEDEPDNLPGKVLHFNELNICDEKKIIFPKVFIDSLVNKWKNIFNSILKKNKDVKIIHACLDTSTFTNCYNVKFNYTHFSFDRSEKEFEIQITPIKDQDLLCFNSKKKLLIHIQSKKLRTLFINFFEQINKIRFCSSCGNFSYTSTYHEDVDMCEVCVFEEISSSIKTEIHMCSICQEENKRMYKTNCGHYFHRKCLSQINPSPFPRCPLCRKALDPSDEYLSDQYHDHDQYHDELNETVE